MDEQIGIEKSSQKFIEVNEEVMHWHSILKVIISTMDKEEKTNNRVKSDSSEKNYAFNTADEIRKLHNLLKEEIITQEEFDLQKKKIMS